MAETINHLQERINKRIEDHRALMSAMSAMYAENSEVDEVAEPQTTAEYEADRKAKAEGMMSFKTSQRAVKSVRLF